MEKGDEIQIRERNKRELIGWKHTGVARRTLG